MKHLLLSAALLLFASNLVAQLHVRPNPSNSTDSYIFANDVVLFVNDEIGLQLNNTEETQASIYLRGDAQLIQGDKGASLNTGNGMLSVWQRGTTNAFDYNYWASPVGNPNLGTPGNSRFGIPWFYDVQEGSITNTLHLTHSIGQNFTTSLDGVPSDREAGLPSDLQISRRWIYTMRANTGYSQWIAINQQNGSGTSGLAAGEGFTMKGTGTLANDGSAYHYAHNQLYDFRGRPNDGDITITVGHNGTSFMETLTGNPYPSALDLAAFFNDPDNNDVEAAAYYWESDPTVNSHVITDQQGGYGVWQPGGTTTVPPELGGGLAGTYTPAIFIMYDGFGSPIGGEVGTGNHYERRFAPIGQGFMVRGHSSIGSSTGTVTFKNTMRRHVRQGAGTFSEFRNTGSDASSLSSSVGAITLPDEPAYIHPMLRFHVGVNDSYVRDMVLMFNPETTKGADRGWDSKHPLVIAAGDAYWVLENETDPYVIQTRPFDEFDIIPLGIRKGNGNVSYKVKVAESIGFNNRMYLFDLQNNIYQRLDIDNIAQINLNGPAGNIENRFYIVFRRNIQDQNIPLEAPEMNLNVFQNNPLSKLQVSNPDMYDIKNASVYDMRGRLVISENNLGKVSRYEFSTAGLSSGVYMVVLTTKDNQMLDYKVTIHNRN